MPRTRAEVGNATPLDVPAARAGHGGGRALRGLGLVIGARGPDDGQWAALVERAGLTDEPGWRTASGRRRDEASTTVSEVEVSESTEMQWKEASTASSSAARSSARGTSTSVRR